MAKLDPQPLNTTGINHMVQNTPYFGDPLLGHNHLGQGGFNQGNVTLTPNINAIDHGIPLAEVIDEQNKRIEELEKLVDKLLIEFMPEYKV